MLFLFLWCIMVVYLTPTYMKIQYFVRFVYGLEKMYIVDGKIKEAINYLTGKSTFSNGDRKALEDLGFTFEQVVDPITQ